MNFELLMNECNAKLFFPDLTCAARLILATIQVHSR